MIGEKIRELRQRKSLSCAELARQSGHPVSSIHGIETGTNKNPRFKIICDICNVLEISKDDLKKYI